MCEYFIYDFNCYINDFMWNICFIWFLYEICYDAILLYEYWGCVLFKWMLLLFDRNNMRNRNIIEIVFIFG